MFQGLIEDPGKYIFLYCFSKFPLILIRDFKVGLAKFFLLYTLNIFIAFSFLHLIFKKFSTIEKKKHIILFFKIFRIINNSKNIKAKYQCITACQI